MGEYEETNIAEMQRVLVFTTTSDLRIEFRHYEINAGNQINEPSVNNKSLEFN